MRIFRKKGFTLLELIIVLAIIAVMSAMIIPSFVGQDENKQRVVDGASNYYTAVQHLMSKFSRVERDYTGAHDLDTNAGNKVIIYDKDFGGNRPIRDFVFIAMEVKDTKVLWVDAYADDDSDIAQAQVLSRKHRSEGDPNHAFVSAFMDEMNALFDGQDGFYYALVYYDDELEDDLNGTPGNNLVKVVMTGYGDHELPIYTGPVEGEEASAPFLKYTLDNMGFSDVGRLSTGNFFGVQSSWFTTQDGVNKYYGEGGTYFRLNND